MSLRHSSGCRSIKGVFTSYLVDNLVLLSVLFAKPSDNGSSEMFFVEQIISHYKIPSFKNKSELDAETVAN